MTPLTDKERRVLEYLDPLMDAFAQSIGEAIHPEWLVGVPAPRSSFSGAGSDVANALVRRGFVQTLRTSKILAAELSDHQSRSRRSGGAREWLTPSGCRYPFRQLGTPAAHPRGIVPLRRRQLSR
jgi:hypothetical protein